MPTSGDILELSYNHPTLGSGTFFPKSAEDSTFDFGGFTSNDDENGIDGGGNMIDQMNRKRWSAEMKCSWDMDKDDLARAQALQNSPVKATWTISHVNGHAYSGKGKPVGDIKGNGNDGTFGIKVAGGLTLEQIV